MSERKIKAKNRSWIYKVDSKCNVTIIDDRGKRKDVKMDERYPVTPARVRSYIETNM